MKSQFVFNGTDSSQFELMIERFHFEEGLKSIRIFDIYCDQNDLIWIVTESSLYTFNGFSFEQKINFGKLRSHPRKIFIDNNENLWLIEPLKLTSNSFERTIAKEVQILSGTTFNSINVKEYVGEELNETYNFFQAKTGVLYFTSPSNPTTYYSFDKELETLLSSKNTTHFNYIEVDEFVTYTDCHSIFIQSKTYDIDTSFKLNGPLLNFRIRNEVFSFTERQEDKILIHSFFKNELKTLKTFHQAYDVDFSGNVFAFQHRNFESSHRELNKTIFKILNEINSFVFQSVLIDSQGNMWIGSHLGLIKISRKSILFNNISSEGLASTRNLLRINEDMFLICSYDGIFTYNLKENKLEKRSKEIYLSAIRVNDEIVLFDKYGQNKILDYPSFSLERTLKINSPIKTQLIGSKELNQKEVLLLSKDKIVKYNSVDHESFLIENPKSYIKYHSIAEHLNDIYICSSMGVFKFLKTSNTLLPILSGYEINYVHFDYEDPNIIWLASTLGLLKFNKETKQIKIIGNEDGLSNTSITSIKEDKKGALWIPTFTGLNRYDKKNERLNRYYTQDGIVNNEFNYHSDLTINEQTFWFGGTNGITVITPELFTNQNSDISNHNISILSGTKILKNSEQKILDISKIENEAEINIYEKDIELRFNLHHPVYNDLRSKELLYKINDSKNEQDLNNWITLKSNILNLTRKPYGSYELEIKVENGNGVQLSDIRKYTLNYVKPFYKEFHFIALSVLGFLILFYYIITFRNRSLERKTKLLEEEVQDRIKMIKEQNLALDKMNKTKDKLFAILAHDLKSPLITLQNLAGKIQYLIETNQVDRLIDIGGSIDDKLSRLSTFLDNILNWSLQQRDHLSYNPESVNISILLNEIIQLYEDNIRVKNIQISLNVSTTHFYHADKNSVHAVVRNIFNNALKYSFPNSEIKIDSLLVKEGYILRIIDNGIGMSEKRIQSITQGHNIDSFEGTIGEKGTGLGLIVSQELMKLNFGKLKVLNNPKNGTIIELLFPIAIVKKDN